jgi:hypothetical protein
MCPKDRTVLITASEVAKAIKRHDAKCTESDIDE